MKNITLKEKIAKKKSIHNQSEKNTASYAAILSIFLTIAPLSPEVSHSSNDFEINKTTKNDAPKKIENASPWIYRSMAEAALKATFLASQDNSSNRIESINKSASEIKALISKMDPDGTWWSPSKSKDGDPNINRFTLAPLLDALYIAESIKDFPSEKLEWKKQALVAANFQYSAYQGKVPWDWAAINYKRYPNQDAYYLLITALAYKLGGENKFERAEQETLDGLESQLMPGGGWHYIAEETESPIYHYITESIISRHFTITGSKRAAAILRASTRYWSNILSATGQPTYIADPWWKQFWLPIPRSAIQLAESINHDEKLTQILNLNDKNFSKESNISRPYVEYWLKINESQKKAHNDDHGFKYDIDAKRYHSEYNDLYTDLVKGRGLRNTFIGIRYCTKNNLTCTSMRAITPELQLSEKDAPLLFLSETESNGIFKETSDGVIYATDYTIQPGLINGIPKPMDVRSDFRISQVWFAKNTGTVGVISIKSLRDLETRRALVSIALGPDKIIKRDGTIEYYCNGLIVKVFQAFGKDSITSTIPTKPAMWPRWSSIQLGAAEKIEWKREQLQYTTLWIGHDINNAPKSVNYDSKTNTLEMQYAKNFIKLKYSKDINSIEFQEIRQ